MPGSIDAIVQLQQHFSVAVCTNQSGLARELFDLNTLHEIHNKMQTAIIEAGGHPIPVYFCPHLQADHCLCRKPQPGLLHSAMQAEQIEPKQTVFIGDSDRDIEAAFRAQCTPMLVLTGNGATALNKIELPDTHIFDDLQTAAATLIAESQ